MAAHAVTDDKERPFFSQFILISGHIMRYVVLIALAPTPDIRQSSSRESKFLSQQHTPRMMGSYSASVAVLCYERRPSYTYPAENATDAAR